MYTWYSHFMGLFGRSKETAPGNICPKCNMEFSGPDRMLRHMIKAHKRKKFECDSCGFRS